MSEINPCAIMLQRYEVFRMDANLDYWEATFKPADCTQCLGARTSSQTQDVPIPQYVSVVFTRHHRHCRVVVAWFTIAARTSIGVDCASSLTDGYQLLYITVIAMSFTCHSGHNIRQSLIAAVKYRERCMTGVGSST